MSAQSAYILLKNSVATSLTFLARTTMPQLYPHSSQSAQDHKSQSNQEQSQQQQQNHQQQAFVRAHPAFQALDSMIQSFFTSKISMPQPPPNVRVQLTLPVSLSGFGITSSAAIANAAWYSSVALTAPIFAPYAALQPSSPITALFNRLAEAFRSTAESASNSEIQNLLPLASESAQPMSMYVNSPASADKLQAKLMSMHYQQQLQQLKHQPSQADSIKLKAAATKEASAWLTAIPTSPALSMSTDEFAFACITRLVQATPPIRSICPDCKLPCSHDHWHPVSCKSALRRSLLLRHNAVVSVVANAIKRAGGLASVEPRNMDNNSAKQPDISGHFQSNAFLIDVSIRNPLSSSQQSQAASLLDTAAQQKTNKYAELARQCHARFVPLIFDIFGSQQALAKEWIQTVGSMGSMQFVASSDDKLTSTMLTKEIAVAIQRYNARATLSWQARALSLQVQQFYHQPAASPQQRQANLIPAANQVQAQ
jgi:hypothetical protein